MLKGIIAKLVEGQNLKQKETEDIIEFISEGKALPSQIGAFLIALKMKGETPEEITGLAMKMREKSCKINTYGIDNIVDSCGTGGDLSNTFNISTASAIVTASSGLHVAKHSNFGFTSKCGSSNVVEKLGLKLVDNSEQAESYLKKHNITFIHAPFFHKATSHVNGVRKELGIKTVFNFLGPLTNPASPTGQVLGVAIPQILPKMAETLNNLGCKRALIVNGQNPALDEISICGKTLIYRVENGKIDSFEVHPKDFGIKKVSIEELTGDTPEKNATIIEDIFFKKVPNAKQDAVIINSAALLWTGNKVNSIEEGIKLASELIYNNKAFEKLEELRNA